MNNINKASCSLVISYGSGNLISVIKTESFLYLGFSDTIFIRLLSLQSMEVTLFYLYEMGIPR